MKTFLLCAALLCAVSASAQETLFAKFQVDDVTENMQVINPKLKLVTQGEILINDRTVSLVLIKEMPTCPSGRFCPQILPTTVTIHFNLTSVVHTECSTKYYAESPEGSGNPLHEELMVEDYSRTTCEAIIRNPGVITYTVAQMNETAAARFFVRGGFVRH